MSLFSDIRRIICCLYGDDPPLSPIERWSIKNAKLCSPDEIIAAAVIESFAKSYEDWSHKMWDSAAYIPQSEVLPSGCSRYDVNSRLVNDKNNFKIYWKWINLASAKSFQFHMYVNDVSLTNKAAREIQEAFYRIKAQRGAIEAAARKAKAEMERNEAAWNLAEKLLGMKRNEHGALVPVVTVTVEETASTTDTLLVGEIGDKPAPAKVRVARKLRFGGVCDDPLCIEEEECLCGRNR